MRCLHAHALIPAYTPIGSSTHTPVHLQSHFAFTFTKPSRVQTLQMHEFHIPTGSVTPTFSLSQVTPTQAGTHVTHSLSHSPTPRLYVRPLTSAPRSGPLSGLRKGRRGAATSPGVSHGPREAGWGALRVDGCWAARIVPRPHGARLATPAPRRLPCSAVPPW